jgi:CDGSH-type Zn-finger protein
MKQLDFARPARIVPGKTHPWRTRGKSKNQPMCDGGHKTL